jgi:hypothetical protein
VPLKRSQLAGFTFILANGNRKQPHYFEGATLPEQPMIYQLIDHYNLKYGYVLAAADLPNEVVYCVLFGKPVQRRHVETVLALISAYVGKTYTVEMVRATLLPETPAVV